jgi:diguanylate cyclase (GGDEF)-like protein
VVRFRSGDTLVRQGEPGVSVFAIVRGRVEVRVAIRRPGDEVEAVPPRSGEGERNPAEEREGEVVVSWLVPGDTLGELALLDGRPRSATCIALTATTCLRLSRDAFRAALQQHWALADAVLSMCAHRLRAADELIAAQARDPLTGVNNRGTLEALYKREAARTQRARRQADAARLRPLGVVFADVDRFKTINDSHGHHVGDQVLRSVASTLTRVGRETDLVARYGGDEFVMLLPDAGEEGTEVVAGRIRETLSHRPPGPVPFTLSLGTAVVDPSRPPPLETVLAQADRAMYRDKERLAG